MYRILLADDEGIMLNALTNIIKTSFGDEFEIATAKTGRTAIEQAEAFHPDIIFMDIQMPGINGIQALREIRKFNASALCYIISAYDTFDYAKEAISLNVETYLMKPIAKKNVISILEEARQKVDIQRRQRSDQLRTREKLENIVPVLENGFISTILLQGDWNDADYYRQLLDVQEEYAYVMVLWFGTEDHDGQMVSPVGMSVRAQGFYPELCAIVKSYWRCIIGAMITSRVVIAVPWKEASMDYDSRIRVIEDARRMVTRLEERLEAKFRAGIGRIRPMQDLRTSYQEAVSALGESSSRVVHTDDIKMHGVYQDDFPAETEKNMFTLLRRGDVEGMRSQANLFFDWMIQRHPEDINNIRLKVLEFILVSEKDAFELGAVDYGFDYRKDYLTAVMALEDLEQIRLWFLDKMTTVCLQVHNKKEEMCETVVSRAKIYIREHYDRDISLDDVSKAVNVSPYYFSKLFKEEEGENFIEYLTRLRITRAKELLGDSALSIREVSLKCGYSDPNYFSRIFKKQTDHTPREYRELAGSGARLKQERPASLI